MASRTRPAGLPYPGKRDYAAGGPDLQKLAEAGDAKWDPDAAGTWADFERMVRNPTVVMRSTLTQGPLPANTGGALVFDTYSFDNRDAATRALDSSGVQIALPPTLDGRTPSWYYIGVSVDIASTGAYTTDSERYLAMTLKLLDPFTQKLTFRTVDERMYQAPVAQPQSLLVEAYIEASGGLVQFRWSHANAVNMQIAAGKAQIWITRVDPQIYD